MMTKTPAIAIDSMCPCAANRRASFLAFPFLALGLAFVPLTPPVQAADGTWIKTDATGNWTDTANWAGTPGVVAQGTDFTAFFNQVDITANRTVTLDTSLIIGHLKFGDTASSHNWTLSSSGGSTLTLDTTTGAPTIDVISGRTATISAILAGDDGMTKTGSGTLILTGNHTYIGKTTVSAGKLQLGTTNAGGSVTGDIENNGSIDVVGGNGATTVLSGVISGSGTITKLNSASSLTLAGNNSYSGATSLSDGTLLLGHDNALGTSTLIVSRGRLGSSDGERTITNTLNFNLTGGLTLGAAQGSSTGTGNITFTSAATGTGNAITVNNATIASLNTQFTNGFITKNGTGTLVLNGSDSTYAGVTKISGGVLSVGKLANINTASSIGKGSANGSAADLVLAGGTLRFTGASSGTTDRPFSLAYGTNGASSVIDTSGSVPLQLTGVGDIGVAANAATTPWSSTDLPVGTSQFTMNDVSQIAVGMGVTGSNIAAGTYVTAIDTATKKVTLSQGLTAAITADGSLTFMLYGGPRTLTLTGTNTGANTLAANLTDAPESNGSQPSLLSHAASLVKDGNGTWIITGTHTYTGITTVSAGTLLVNNTSGLGTGTGAVSVTEGAILGGSGTIGGASTIAGTLSVGGGADTTLEFSSSLTLQGTATTLLDIASATLYDSINIAGAFIYGGGIEISLLNGFTLGADQSYNLFNFGDTIASGTLQSFSVATTALQETTVGSGVWTGTNGELTYTFTTATGVLEVAASAIPEPSTYAAIVGALALGAVLVRRRRRAQAQA